VGKVDWTTQGVANRIIDNLIASRMVQPMVIVMTDFNNLGSCNLFPPDEDASCYAADVSNYVIPYVNAHYNVSTDANDRAFAGLSLGGLAANYLLFNDTTPFGYFGSWSIANLGAPATTSARWHNPALKTRLGIELGGRNFDQLTIPGLDSYEATFTSFGIPFTDVRIDGGHEGTRGASCCTTTPKRWRSGTRRPRCKRSARGGSSRQCPETRPSPFRPAGACSST
jgi:Putative esterase